MFKQIQYIKIYLYIFLILWISNKILKYIIKFYENKQKNKKKKNLILSTGWLKSINKNDFQEQCYKYLSLLGYKNIIFIENGFEHFICYKEKETIVKSIHKENNKLIEKEDILIFLGYLINKNINEGIILTNTSIAKSGEEALVLAKDKGYKIAICDGEKITKEINKINDLEILEKEE